MEDQIFTHVIVDISDFDAYSGDKEKIVGMYVANVDDYKSVDLNLYEGRFSLSKEDNKILDISNCQHRFLSAKLRKLTVEEINKLNN